MFRSDADFFTSLPSVSWEKATKIIQAFCEGKGEECVALTHRNAPENNSTTDEMSAFELNNFVTRITLITLQGVQRFTQIDSKIWGFENIWERWLFLYHFAPLNQEFLLRYRDAVEENGLQKIAQGFAQDRLSNRSHLLSKPRDEK